MLDTKSKDFTFRDLPVVYYLSHAVTHQAEPLNHLMSGRDHRVCLLRFSGILRFFRLSEVSQAQANSQKYSLNSRLKKLLSYLSLIDTDVVDVNDFIL